MKILYFRFDLTLVDDDIIEGLKSLGVSIETIDIVTRGKRVSTPIYLDELIHRVHTLRPDIIMCSNENALDDEGLFSRVFAHYHVPLVTWFVDRPVVSPAIREKKFLKHASIIFVIDKTHMEQLKNEGFENVHLMPLGANPNRSREPVEKWSLPPVFVGKLDLDRSRDALSRLRQRWPNMNRLDMEFIEGAIEYYRLNPLMDALGVVDEIMAKTGLRPDIPTDAMNDLERFMEYEAGLRHRVEIVSGIKDMGITTVGEKDWGLVVGKDNARGFVRYGSDELVDIYNKSLAVLNITRPQLKDGVNQRVFDVPLAGGLLLTDAKDQVYELFDVPEEMDVYTSVQDLRQKITYFRYNPAERIRKIKKARKRVMESHLYRHRLEDMLNIIGTTRLQFDIPSNDKAMERIKPYLPGPAMGIDVNERHGCILLTSPGDLVCEDIAWGMRKAGIACSLYNTAKTDGPEGRKVSFDLDRIKAMLEELKPDFVISNNGLGVDAKASIQKMLADRGIPFVTWYTDEPNLVESGGILPYILQNTIVFSFDSIYIPMLEKRGFAYVDHLELATNTDRFYPAEEEDPIADIVFVGSSGKKQIDAIKKDLERMGIDGKAMSLHIEHIVPIYIANWQSPIEDVFDMSWKGGPIPLEIKPSLLAWIEHRAGQYLRLSILNRIKGFNLKVIGEDHWAELMGHEYYGGEIVYTKDNLARLYANTPIIINISRPQLKTTLNQRVYDVPASEGFLLTDKRQRLYQVFEERDMASYDYSSDIASLLRYYLERPELRREMAQSARKKILDGHTYVHRAKKIINTVLSVTS